MTTDEKFLLIGEISGKRPGHEVRCSPHPSVLPSLHYLLPDADINISVPTQENTAENRSFLKTKTFKCIYLFIIHCFFQTEGHFIQFKCIQNYGLTMVF